MDLFLIRLPAPDSSYLSFLIADPPVELFSVDAEEVFTGVDDPTLDGDGPGRVDVVSRHHAHRDAGTLALQNGIRHLQQDTRTHGIISL